MDRYTKAFVAISLLWFALAAALGGWMATTNAPEWAYFGHVHFNLLGFMAMMIYGVGYFILPRFNARPLAWPGWVPVQFWVSNIGLVGLVATFPERPSAGFLLFAGLSAAGAVMFALNLGVTVLGRAPAEQDEAVPHASPAPQAPAATSAAAAVAATPPPSTPPTHPARISPDTRVGEILTRWPQLVEVLVAGGLAPLANPDHREKVKGAPVTLGMACTNHGLDCDAIVQQLNAALAAAAVPPPRRIGPNDVIGEVLKAHPATETVFRKYYGAACFSCPGQATETVRQSAMMHNAKEAELLRELNEAAGLL
jgi:hypothetical protein